MARLKQVFAHFTQVLKQYKDLIQSVHEISSIIIEQDSEDEEPEEKETFGEFCFTLKMINTNTETAAHTESWPAEVFRFQA